MANLNERFSVEKPLKNRGKVHFTPPTPIKKILVKNSLTRRASDTILWKLLALKLRFRDMRSSTYKGSKPNISPP